MVTDAFAVQDVNGKLYLNTISSDAEVSWMAHSCITGHGSDVLKERGDTVQPIGVYKKRGGVLIP